MREDPLLGAALFFVAAGAADRRIVAAGVERLPQSLRLHDVGIARGAVIEGVDVVGQALGVRVHDQLEPVLLRHPVAEGDHLAELPGRIDVEHRERDAAGKERLASQVQQDARILADGVHHHRLLEACGHLAEDFDAFGFQ